MSFVCCYASFQHNSHGQEFIYTIAKFFLIMQQHFDKLEMLCIHKVVLISILKSFLKIHLLEHCLHGAKTHTLFSLAAAALSPAFGDVGSSFSSRVWIQ